MAKYDIAAFIWPSYTGDEPRTKIFWPEGYGEWQSVKSANAKYEGDSWPRKPLWGYVNEANPDVMEMEINCALRHGVNVFIYDWYWFDDRPFLENCLNDGFLKAPNCNDMKFYIMWANHDANQVWSKVLSDTEANTVVWKGAVTFDVFKHIVARMIEKYFCKPNYYKIDGCPVFMLYQMDTLIEGFGGIEETKKALAYLREEVKKAGYPDVHIQITARNHFNFNVSGVDAPMKHSTNELLELLDMDSSTHYQFCHFTNMDRDYLEILEDVKITYKDLEKGSKPYFPHVSVGWDNNPRYVRLGGWVTKNNTPENFEKALRIAKEYADRHPEQPPLITVNSWNEWTETSYLEPDDLYGYGYLEAVKRVFVDEE